MVSLHNFYVNRVKIYDTLESVVVLIVVVVVVVVVVVIIVAAVIVVIHALCTRFV